CNVPVRPQWSPALTAGMTRTALSERGVRLPAAMEPGTYGRDDRSHETHAVTRNVAAPCERLPERRRGEVCRRSFQGAKCARPGCERSPAIGAPPDRSQRSDDGGT